MPVTIGREKSRAAAQEAARQQRPLGILLQKSPEIDDPKPEEMHWVGTTANVLRYVTAAEGTHHIVVQGEERFRALYEERRPVYESAADARADDEDGIVLAAGGVHVRPGALVLMTGMGAGLTWGSALMEWTAGAPASGRIT